MCLVILVIINWIVSRRGNVLIVLCSIFDVTSSIIPDEWIWEERPEPPHHITSSGNRSGRRDKAMSESIPSKQKVITSSA